MPLDPSTLLARRLRRDATEVERRMWQLLRSRALAGWKFRRQHPIERYVADFACPAAKLVIELDGGQHAERAAQDAERTSALARHGWRVLRFWNTEVVENAEGVAETILAALRARR
jgi:very-short-patch-repair endonuclease